MTADLNLGDTQLIIDKCKAFGCDLNQAAYILATARWETGHTMKPVQEAYWLSDKWRRLNLRYYPWHGRGYVQITWQRNYLHAGQKLNLDLTTDPDFVMRPNVAVRILVRGMMEGWFTNHKLPDHVSGDKADFVAARRVVNGTDKAQAIASIAQEYVEALQGVWNETTKSEPAKEPAKPGAFAALITVMVTFILSLFGGRK